MTRTRVKELRGMTRTRVKEPAKTPEADVTLEVQKFLTKLELREAKEGEWGTTWLELYTLYKALGHPCAVPDPMRAALARPSLGRQLQTFKALARKVARQKLCQKDQELFKVCTKKGTHLRGLA